MNQAHAQREPLGEDDLCGIMKRSRCAGEARFTPDTLTAEQRERAADTQALLLEVARLRTVVARGADALEDLLKRDPEAGNGEIVAASCALREMRLEESR